MTKRVLPGELHWTRFIDPTFRVQRLSSVASKVDNKNTGLASRNLLSLSFGNIIEKDIDALGGLLPQSFEGYNQIEPGDIVLRLTDLQNDQRSLRSAISTSTGIITSAYTTIRPTKINSIYLSYFLRAADHGKLFYSLGGGLRQTMNFDDLKTLPIIVPPDHQQQLIADYLDHETAEIDDLIAKHQQLADLVHERTESHVNLTIAGTPSTGARDSNNPWIGQIPSHWTIQKLAWIFPTIGSGTTPQPEDIRECTGGIPWVTSGELREKGIGLTRRGVTPEARRDYSALRIFPPQSILIAMYGATIGRLGWLEVSATVNQAICALSGYRLGPAKYPYYALMAARKHILTLASGGGQPNISQDKVRSLRIPVPPSDEQVSLVKNLDRALEHDALVTGDVSLILTLARERRAALITAAVTGQIDVTARNKPAAEQLEDDIAQGLHREN